MAAPPRLQPAAWRRFAPAGCAAFIACAALGCRESPAPSRPHSTAGARRGADARPPVDVEPTIHLMRQLHAERDYDRLATFVAPAGRAAFLDTLVAMDQFIAANAALQTSLRATMDEALLPEWDLSPWADAMGLFAPRVSIIASEDDGRTASVRYQVADHVPLESASMEWTNNRWTYDPGAALPALAPAIRELASTLNAMAREVRRSPRTRDELDAEFRLRVVPRLNRVLAAAATQPAAGDDHATTTVTSAPTVP